MREYELKTYLNDPNKVKTKIKEYESKGIVKTTSSKYETEGHLQKAEHNLEFINQVQEQF